jgi:3',5'-cyclic-AMP phosphodiesterase
MNRRHFLSVLGATAGGATIVGSQSAAAQSPANAWTFVHFTDTHIQPELRADEGCRQAFRKIRALQPDFVVSGGDLVFDTLAVDRPRADKLFGMYEDAIKELELPLYNTVGNHDVFGLYTKSGVEPSDPMYGKRMYEDYIGARYHSFDHKGWHFIVLDSIGMTPDRRYIGHIDEQQMEWLRQDLAVVGNTTPIVVITHIALASGFPSMMMEPGASTAGVVITNSREVLAALMPYNVKAVLQGHLHIIENIRYKGTQFITAGAVSGNWWKGQRFGFDEGFSVLTVEGDQISWRYETYGWKAVGA